MKRYITHLFVEESSTVFHVGMPCPNCLDTSDKVPTPAVDEIDLMKWTYGCRGHCRNISLPERIAIPEVEVHYWTKPKIDDTQPIPAETIAHLRKLSE